MPSSMDRMKHLLSTGDRADVHFLVGDGDEKELLPAHQLILKSASDVFEAMFRFDAKKERPENVSVNCPVVVEIPDIEAAEFKVMLSFIYTKDLSDLNGDNAMAVLYAAKKYNIPGLVDRSLQIPISKLRNVFFAYAQALLFDLEDFACKCLRYICQNAAQLFGSDDFLQIDQKMLCVLLDRDRLLLNNEFEIWKIALRWADEKCRQNGIECSSGNRRSVLGPALFKIRFPNIHEEDFSKFVGLSWIIKTEKRCGYLGFYLWCDAKEERSWNCVFSATYRIVSEMNEAENSIGTLCDCVINRPSCTYLGFGNFITFEELMDPRNGFYNKSEGKVTLVIDVTVKDEKIEKFLSNPNKSNGTISMDIEKVSEFARETNRSERKSETVHIKGLPWKVWARIKKKIGRSTDNNEKWLSIFLLSDAPEEENWSCECSSTFRIVSQKNGVKYSKREISKEKIDNKMSYKGFPNFISFSELMDPAKGFYDKSKDKVTLAIDVSVK
ncbi:hypothetical protein niasHT_016635 [Heterodera trifolii]|uniref:BTB domain-containing protein n=1 Tax=Heterodera trifolii TaxID=157864 RepID=A0ABD2LLI0_9BILA